MNLMHPWIAAALSVMAWCVASADGGLDPAFDAPSMAPIPNLIAFQKDGRILVNVGSGVSTSIKELWSMMAGASALTPRTASSRPHDIVRLALSPVRARIQLGWSPYTPLKDGLAGLRAD